MISNMVIGDLLPFLSILFIFMLAFGVVFHSLLYPNAMAFKKNITTTNETRIPISWSVVIKNMLGLTFYSMLGEYQLDRMKVKWRQKQ